jgi:hypothetical protein
MVLHGSEVYQNMVQQHAGGVLVRDECHWTITDGSSVRNNQAHMNGGGIFAKNNSTIVLSRKSSVLGNIAGVAPYTTPPHYASAEDTYRAGVNGAQLWAWCKSSVPDPTPTLMPHADDALLMQNGGGVFAQDNASIDITDGSMVQGNIASRAGGGLYVIHSKLYISGASSVNGNTAGTFGGGLVALNAKIYVKDSQMSMNTACNSAGGLLAI